MFAGLRDLRRRVRDTTGLFAELHRQGGAMADYRILAKRFNVVFDPEIMEEALLRKHACLGKGKQQQRTLDNLCIVTADGDDHKWRRKLLQPSFTPNALRGYAVAMVEEAVRQRDSVRDGQELDIDHLSHELSLSITARTFFGDDLHVEPAIMKEALAGYRWRAVLGLLPLGRVVKALPLPRTIASERAIKRLDDRVYEAIRKARASAQERTDLIAHLVAAWDEGHPAGTFPESALKDEAFAILVAAHENTAVTLTWCFYHLSRNPGARERLEAELEEVLGHRLPGFDDVERLVYTKAVMDETMRLTPTATYLGRTALEDIELGGRPIPRHSVTQFSIRTPMRDAKYFPQPERFRPERWLSPSADLPRLAYAPFGAGNRFCSGFRFATIQMVLALAIIARRWRFELVSKEDPAVVDFIIYKCKDGLPVVARERTGKAENPVGGPRAKLQTRGQKGGRMTDIPPVFVFSTGRCGSTMVSEMLNQHSGVLSMSEFFAQLGVAAFTRKKISGDEMWRMYSEHTPRMRIVTYEGLTEVLYPFTDPAARFNAENLPPILAVTLPHLTDKYEELFDELGPAVRAMSDATPADHIRALCQWLGQRRGSRVWVERHGGSLILASRLLRYFPEARIVHMYRDGRETALSMAKHPPFKLALARARRARRIGLDAYRLLERFERRDRLTQAIQKAQWRRTDLDAFMAEEATLPEAAELWSKMIETGHRVFGHFPPDRLLNLRFEDMQQNPAEEARRLIRFISPELDDDAWVAEVAKIPRQTESKFAQLDSAQQAAITAACRPGLERLGYSS